MSNISDAVISEPVRMICSTAALAVFHTVTQWLCAYTHTVWSHGWKWGVVSCSQMCNSPETFHCTDSSAAVLCVNAVRDSLRVVHEQLLSVRSLIFVHSVLVVFSDVTQLTLSNTTSSSFCPTFLSLHASSALLLCNTPRSSTVPYRGAPGVPWCFAVFLCVLVPVRCP